MAKSAKQKSSMAEVLSIFFRRAWPGACRCIAPLNTTTMPSKTKSAALSVAAVRSCSVKRHAPSSTPACWAISAASEAVSGALLGKKSASK